MSLTIRVGLARGGFCICAWKSLYILRFSGWTNDYSDWFNVSSRDREPQQWCLVSVPDPIRWANDFFCTHKWPKSDNANEKGGRRRIGGVNGMFRGFCCHSKSRPSNSWLASLQIILWFEEFYLVCVGGKTFPRNGRVNINILRIIILFWGSETFTQIRHVKHQTRELPLHSSSAYFIGSFKLPWGAISIWSLASTSAPTPHKYFTPLYPGVAPLLRHYLWPVCSETGLMKSNWEVVLLVPPPSRNKSYVGGAPPESSRHVTR